jgi:predicted ATP-grasp superfamily ATP-dependent carboligase
VPLVVDAFGDSDTRAAAEDYLQLPDAVRLGFRAKPLFAALDTLADRADSPPIGIVLGSGFEDRPKLIASLDARYRLLGTKAETVAEVKDPRRLFTLMKQLGIAYPETSLMPPDNPDGWVAKRIGGAGGAHIRNAVAGKAHAPRTYYQRRLGGIPMSVFAVASKTGVAIELSRQWTCASPRKPYRYGGAVMIDYSETVAEQQMVSAAATLIELLDPIGLVSFDFLVHDDRAYCLEINPRPGATLDVFDDAGGNLFRAHIEAGLGNELWQQRDLPTVQSRASALLYADRGALIAGDIDWPEWAADRPLPGTTIPVETPIATVRADGTSAAEAEALVRDRLSHLADLVYTKSQKA